MIDMENKQPDAKERYVPPVILDISPVSIAVRGDSGIDEDDNMGF